MNEKKYHASSLETAACLWEATLDFIANGGGVEGMRAQIEAARERIGTAGLRLSVLGFVDALDEDWASVKDEYPESFDWEFVPAWLASNVTWSEHYPTLVAERTVPGRDA